MAGESQRIDKWLWHSRLVKTRSLAAALVNGGAVRVNRLRIAKPSHAVAPGDVLTLTLGGRILVVRILDLAGRRGPAAQARLLYEDLTAPAPGPTPPRNQEV